MYLFKDYTVNTISNIALFRLIILRYRHISLNKVYVSKKFGGRVTIKHAAILSATSCIWNNCDLHILLVATTIYTKCFMGSNYTQCASGG